MRMACSMAIVATMLMMAGCSKEQRDQLAETVSQAKEQVSNKAQDISQKATASVNKATETVVADGQSQMKLDKELDFGATFANLIVLKNHGTVLQLRSYKDKSNESFPAYYFHANTTAASINSLSGQSVSGSLFVKADQNEATMISSADQPVSISLDNVADGKLKGRFVSGELITVQGRKLPINGSFEAMIEGGLE